jgi:hypothetical protein
MSHVTIPRNSRRLIVRLLVWLMWELAFWAWWLEPGAKIEFEEKEENNV